MPDLPTNILSQLVSVPHLPALEKAYLIGKDPAPGEIFPWAENKAQVEIALQYWPESITDSREITWNPRYIPGGSHPIYQWTHGGERRVGFTAVFTTDTEPEHLPLSGSADIAGEIQQFGDANAYPTENAGITAGLKIGTRDLDLRAVVSWLRYFTYPYYSGKTAEDIRVFEPPKILLVMPNTKLGHTGNDHITTIMTQCEVTYQEWFPSGFPRMLEVALEFAEVVQENGRVRFHSRKDMGLMSKQVSSYLKKVG